MKKNGNSGLRFKKGLLYEVAWRDHFSQEGWYDLNLSEVHDDYVVVSVGYFLQENENYIFLVRTVGKEMCADIMAILKNNITEARRI